MLLGLGNVHYCDFGPKPRGMMAGDLLSGYLIPVQLMHATSPELILQI